MNDSQSSHPDHERLAAFALGQLSADQSDEIGAHVASCTACGAEIDNVADDTFIALLRSSSTIGDSSETPPRQFADQVSSASATPAADIPAELANHPLYRVIRVLGGGGMGTVYLAEHRLMERRVALKLIKETLLERPAVVERFLQEMKAVARLAHPRIVAAYGAEKIGSTYLLAMEHVEGETLDRRVQDHGPLPVRLACDCIRQAAEGVQHAFEMGLVHRDLKPHNLMITSAGQVKVLDFGLARVVSENGQTGPLTGSGVVLGTPDYLAPEQSVDAHQADIRADIYSLGCTLYFLITGQPPFPDGSVIEKVLAHHQKTPRPLRDFRADIPAPLCRVVDRMLAKDPGRRYQTPSELISALTPWCSPHEANAPGRKCGPVSPHKLRALALPALLALATAVIGAIGYHFWNPTQANNEAPPETVGATQAAPAPGPLLARIATKLGPFDRAAFSPDCQRFLAADPGRTFRLLDRESGRELAQYVGHSAAVLAMAFSSDGKRILSGGRDNTVRLWDLASTRCLKVMEGHGSWVRGVCFMADDRGALSAGNDGTIIRWDTDEGQARKRFAGHRAPIASIALSSSGRLAVSGSWDQTIRVWDVFEGKEIHCLNGHGDGVSLAIFSADGRSILSGGRDRTVRLWRTATGTEVRCLEGHTAIVSDVAMSANGRFALAGDVDGVIRLWDLESGKECACFRGHEGKVVALAFCPDGRRAASVGQDGTICLWQLPPEAQKASPPGPAGK